MKTSTEQVEEQLRGTFARSAQNIAINPDAWNDFQRRANSAHPIPASREHTRLVPLLVAAAAAVAVGGVGVIAQSVLNPPAYASWHSTPDALTPSERNAIVSECEASNPAIFDRRGHHVYVLSDEKTQWKSCVATLPGQSGEGLSDTYVSSTPKRATNTVSPTPTPPITLTDVKTPEGNHVKGEPSPLVYISGQTTKNVSRVTITTSKGLVEATLKNGRFAAWWPGNDTHTAIVRAYGQNGQEVAHLASLDH